MSMNTTGGSGARRLIQVTEATDLACGLTPVFGRWPIPSSRRDLDTMLPDLR